MSASLTSIEELASAQFTVNRVYVGAVTFLIYDHLLTLDDEITHMWRFSRLELGKALFFLNRYGVPLELSAILCGFLIPEPTPEVTVNIVSVLRVINTNKLVSCRGWYLFQEFSSLASLAVVEIALLLRTWILWGANRILLITLSIFLIICLGATAVILYYTGDGSHFVTAPELSLSGCISATAPSQHFWTFWIPIVGFESLLCVLTIAKVIEHKRRDIHGPLIDTLDRDGLIYFLLSLSLSLINMLIFALVPLQYKAIGLPLVSSTLSVTCSRMLLNVRTVTRPNEPHESDMSPLRAFFEMTVLHPPPVQIGTSIHLSPSSQLQESPTSPSVQISPITPQSHENDWETRLLSAYERNHTSTSRAANLEPERTVSRAASTISGWEEQVVAGIAF